MNTSESSLGSTNTFREKARLLAVAHRSQKWQNLHLCGMSIKGENKAVIGFALTCYRRALQLNPASDEARLSLAIVNQLYRLLRRLGQETEAKLRNSTS